MHHSPRKMPPRFRLPRCAQCDYLIPARGRAPARRCRSSASCHVGCNRFCWRHAYFHKKGAMRSWCQDRNLRRHSRSHPTEFRRDVIDLTGPVPRVVRVERIPGSCAIHAINNVLGDTIVTRALFNRWKYNYSTFYQAHPERYPRAVGREGGISPDLTQEFLRTELGLHCQMVMNNRNYHNREDFPAVVNLTRRFQDDTTLGLLVFEYHFEGGREMGHATALFYDTRNRRWMHADCNLANAEPLAGHYFREAEHMCIMSVQF